MRYLGWACWDYCNLGLMLLDGLLLLLELLSEVGEFSLQYQEWVLLLLGLLVHVVHRCLW